MEEMIVGRIVIVDDETYQAELMRDILKMYFSEHEVVSYSEVHIAIRNLYDKGADILILDIRMPGMNGFELLSRLSLDKNTKIIIISAYNDFEYARSALRKGVCEYLLKPLSKKDMDSLVLLIKKHIETQHMTETKSQENNRDIVLEESLEKCCAYIREHYVEDITLSMLSDFIHMSPAYLSHVFKSNVGIGYKQYLTKIRMKKACEMLKNTNKKVYEIAELVGYDNYASFNKIFQKEFCVSPQKYRMTDSSKF